MTLLSRRRMEIETQRDQPVRQGRSTVRRWLSTIVLVVVFLGTMAVPARAHVRVFLGFGLPVAPYPYAYSYAPPPCYAPYPPYVAYGAVPPPAWVQGYWTRPVGPWWRHTRVWVPSHAR